MGIPFPTGLRALASIPVPEFPAAGKGEFQENAVEWAWAMNAGSSVLGSILAMVIAIQFGLRYRRVVFNLYADLEDISGQGLDSDIDRSFHALLSPDDRPNHLVLTIANRIKRQGA